MALNFKHQAPPLGMSLSVLAPGILEVPAATGTTVSIHVGPPIQVSCREGGNYRGPVVPGDIDIIPPGIPMAWEINAKSTVLLLTLPPALMNSVAIESELDPARAEVITRIQIRDPQIEHIGLALKAEMEAGCPNGSLFLEGLGTALAAHLLQHHSSHLLPMRELKGGMSGRKLRQVLSYIDDNLDRNLSLAEIAEVAGLSVSHLKTLFRQSTGSPVHQYVIRRRVDRAKMLLSERNLSISQIALATGFAHQSQLARHMRRVLGANPTEIRKGLL
jgi:AraC family transcriptional regulator